jgi:hypothetical protein
MYTLTTNGKTIVREDGATIPTVLGNKDYAEFLNWLSKGNVATPAPVAGISPVATSAVTPVVAGTLEQAKATQTAAIRKACRAAMSGGFQSAALGTIHTYPTEPMDQINLNMRVNGANIATSAPVWTPGGQHAENELVLANKQVFVCTKAGTSSSNPQNWDVSIGDVVDDGTCHWKIWTTQFWCKNSDGVWGLNAHTITQIRQVTLDGDAAMRTIQQRNHALQLSIEAATDLETVNSVTWD